MKFILSASFSFFLAFTAIAQTEGCKVLMVPISGTYKGDCKDGLANGEGKSVGEDTYTGTFKDGLPDGKGKYTSKNGDVYQGGWKNGKKDGKGKYKFTLNGTKYNMEGYWKDGEYVGPNEPNTPYRVSSSTGIMGYKVVKESSASDSSSSNRATITIKSAFTDFFPDDLNVEKSSGTITTLGKKVVVSQYFTPLHCEISYTIRVGEMQKQCRFIVDLLESGSYSITLSND